MSACMRWAKHMPRREELVSHLRVQQPSGAPARNLTLAGSGSIVVPKDASMGALSRRQLLQGSLTLASVGLLSGCGVVPAWSQQPRRVPRLGVLSLGSAADPSASFDAFRQGLSELGYVEGQNLGIEYRFVEGSPDRLPELAAELVRIPVDVIVARGTPPILAAKNATGSIPILFGAANDPVGAGFVASLASPGGNVTGSSALTYQLGGKRLELLKEAVPGVSHVAVLAHQDDQSLAPSLSVLRDAAAKLGVELRVQVVRDPNDLDPAFEEAMSQHADALLTAPGPIILSYHPRIVELAAAHRLPAMYHLRDFVAAGGLLAYGANAVELWRRLATYVDRILKGAKPADLPVEQPTKFDFFINLKAAQALGLTIPQAVLQQATEIIQ